jgi:peptidoglycan/LPS O-acetylase OafA/YrhL
MTEKASKAPNHWPLLDFLGATAALLDRRKSRRFHAAGSFDLVRYLIPRFVRIYIVYIPALVITEAVFLVGSILLSDPGAVDNRPLISQQQMHFGRVSQAICHLAGLQGFSCPAWAQNQHLWSLGYEWALYLFAPAILQLIVWKASPGLRLIAIALICAIAATVCVYPGEAVGWFIAWFLGAASYRILRAGLVPLPAGLLGTGLIIAGIAISRLRAASLLETRTIVAAGTAIVIACRPIVALPLAPRLFGWAAGFSYTLYAVHISLVFLIVAIFQNIVISRRPGSVPPC